MFIDIFYFFIDRFKSQLIKAIEQQEHVIRFLPYQHLQFVQPHFYKT